MQLCDRAGRMKWNGGTNPPWPCRTSSSECGIGRVLESVHRQFLLLAEGTINNNDLHVAEHRTMLVCSLVAQGKEKEAESIRQEGLSAATPEGQWQWWTGLGNEFCKLGRLFDAKDAFSRALKLSEGLAEQRIERQIESAGSLGGVLGTLRDWQAAEVLARQAIRFADGKPNKDLAQVIFLNFSLAISLEAQEKKEDAQAVWLENLSIVERARKDGTRRILGRLRQCHLVCGPSQSDPQR